MDVYSTVNDNIKPIKKASPKKRKGNRKIKNKAGADYWAKEEREWEKERVQSINPGPEGRKKDRNPNKLLQAVNIKNPRRLIYIKEMFGLSGIYRLYRNNELVYIGESICMFSRILQHMKEGKKDFDAFNMHKMNCSDAKRKNKERILIDRFKPEYNIVHKYSSLPKSVRTIRG